MAGRIASIREWINDNRKWIVRMENRLLLILGFLGLVSVLFEFGFHMPKEFLWWGHFFQAGALLTFAMGQAVRILVLQERVVRWQDPALAAAATLSVIFQLYFLGLNWDWERSGAEFISTLIFQGLTFLVFIVELGASLSTARYRGLNPSMVFIMSFILLIFFGTALLMMPRCTVGGISFIDALFTSTSAVCVTGLAAVDTEFTFTLLGKSILLFLIQLGGLGVMTFTTFFGYFFQGTTSLHSTNLMKDYLNEDNLSSVFTTLVRVMIVTAGIELTGAVLIWFSVSDVTFGAPSERWFFSVFHSISAFCNAGFSTISAGLYDDTLRYNYNLHLIIAFLIIFGGLGFPIMFNYLRLFSFRAKSWIRYWLFHEKIKHKPRIINVSSRLVVVTTFCLLVLGTVGMYLLEADHSFSGRSTWGKVVSAFFAAVTPRTAGYNTVDMLTLTPPAILFTILLMWIGASPGSTGGGVKTTTFAVAVLNIGSIARAKDRVEVFRREISKDTTLRAMVIIILSLIVIGTATFMLSLTDPGKNILHLAFEAFSAYGTVGLSINLTMSLSVAGKLIIITCMFLGRVGTLTLLTALVQRMRNANYHYPSENIILT